nr:unnamed protein product [Digitaria exilis]
MMEASRRACGRSRERAFRCHSPQKKNGLATWRYVGVPSRGTHHRVGGLAAVGTTLQLVVEKQKRVAAYPPADSAGGTMDVRWRALLAQAAPYVEDALTAPHGVLP